MPKSRAEQKRENRARYYALGRFVEEFETMVDAVRGAIRHFFPMVEPPYDDTKLNVILTNPTLGGAEALAQAWRGIIGESIRYKKYDDDRLKRLKQLFSPIYNEYRDLASLRNVLLHGTWTNNRESLEQYLYKFSG